MKKIFLPIIILCFVIELFAQNPIVSNATQLAIPDSIIFLEDFSVFESNAEVEKYFGEENVSYETEDLGAGWVANVSTIFPQKENQIMIVWDDINPENVKIKYISQYKHWNADELEPGGTIFPYKNGIKKDMSLEEIVKLNEDNVDFYDLSFNLGRQFIVGMIVKESLKAELQNYIIYLKYKDKIDFDNQPADYQYLQNDRLLSSDDKNIIPSKLIIDRIEYSPNK